MQNSKLTLGNPCTQRTLSPLTVTGTCEDDELYHPSDYVIWQKGDYPDGLVLSGEPFKSSIFSGELQKKSERCAPTALEENKCPFCKLPLGAAWQGTAGGVWELRVLPGWELAGKWGPRYHTCNKMNLANQ